MKSRRGIQGAQSVYPENQFGSMSDAAGDIEAALEAPAQFIGEEFPIIFQAHKGNGFFDQTFPSLFVLDVETAKEVDVFIDRHVQSRPTPEAPSQCFFGYGRRCTMVSPKIPISPLS